MSFGRMAFRRSVPRPAMHGRKCCNRRTGETWPNPGRSSREKWKHAKDSNFNSNRCPCSGATLTWQKTNSCALIGNGCFVSANGRKPRPTVSAMRAQQGIPKARRHPGPDFLFAQIVSDRCDELVENVGMYFVERIVILRGEIIPVRKFRWPFSVGAWAIEKFYERPERGSRRNCGDPQKWRRQFRSDRFAHRIDVSRNPFVSFMAVNPEGNAPAFSHP